MIDVYILDIAKRELVEAEIISAKIANMPLKKDGWNFNWKKLFDEKNTKTYVLRIKTETATTEGVLQLRIEEEMLIMDLIEIAPHNLGSTSKKYDFVAGCLIAFACRESFITLDGNYKGYLTFTSKTKLINWYSTKYGAVLANGQNMYIDEDQGSILINEYLYRTK